MDPNKSIPGLWKEEGNNRRADEEEEEENNGSADEEEEDCKSTSEEDSKSMTDEENNRRRMAHEEENRKRWAEEQDLWEKKMRVRKEEEKEKEEFGSIFNALLKDNKCPIVVDDIYGVKIINNLITRFSVTSSGSRMILIMKYPSLISDLPKQGQGALHLTLQLRDDNESWALFTHILKVTVPPQLLSLRGDILKTCCGLPLIIKKLAVVLSNKDTTIDEW